MYIAFGTVSPIMMQNLSESQTVSVRYRSDGRYLNCPLVLDTIRQESDVSNHIMIYSIQVEVIYIW